MNLYMKHSKVNHYGRYTYITEVILRFCFTRQSRVWTRWPFIRLVIYILHDIYLIFIILGFAPTFIFLYFNNTFKSNFYFITLISVLYSLSNYQGQPWLASIQTIYRLYIVIHRDNNLIYLEVVDFLVY